MKKLIFTILSFAFFGVSVFAQEVQEVQNTVLFKRSATWCPPCGSWGWSLFEGLVEEVEEGGVMIAAHHSGDLISSAAKEITDHFGAFSQPRFYLNETDQNATSSNWQNKKEDIKSQIASTFNTISPVAGVGIKAWYLEDIQEVTLETKTKFFQNANGTFRLGLYLIENEIVNYQASQGNDAIHEKVMRESLVGTSFGEIISQDAITAGTEIDKTYTFLLGDVLTKHYEIVGILWEEDANGNFSFVNVVMTDEFDTNISSVNEIPSDLANLKIMPTVSENSTLIEVNLTQNFENVELEIFNVLGQSVLNLSNQNLTEGTYQFEVLKSDVGSAGQFFVRMKIGNQVKTKSLIFN